MTKPIDLGTTMWTPSGLMRVVLIPIEIERDELARVILVGKYFLTKREFRVGRLLGAGVTRKEIADELGLSDDVVASELLRLYGKLGVRNEKQACTVLGRYGVCGVDDEA
jgi:DNA-binding NarL/FixJ family response regulator